MTMTITRAYIQQLITEELNKYRIDRITESKPYHGSKIIVFDLDDTLVITSARIHVTDPKSNKTYTLTPEEYNAYQAQANDQLDFSEFRSLDILKAGKLIDYYLKILQEAYRRGIPVSIVTARDNRDLIYQWFKEHIGYPIARTLIYAVTDPVHDFHGTIADRKKMAFRELIDRGYTDFQFYDDDPENLRLVKSIEAEFPNVRIAARRAYKQYSR